MIAQRIKNNNVGKNRVLGRITTDLYIEKLEKQGYCVLNLNEEGPEEFKNKMPGLYGKVYKEGRQEGIKTSKEIVETRTRVMVNANIAKRKAEEKELVNKKDFKALVAEYMKEHKCGKARAIMFVANSHPDAHKEYIRSTNERPNKTVKEVPGNKTVFETRVDEYKEKHKCSKGTAILAVARSHPDVHKEYVAALRKR